MTLYPSRITRLDAEVIALYVPFNAVCGKCLTCHALVPNDSFRDHLEEWHDVINRLLYRATHEEDHDPR